MNVLTIDEVHKLKTKELGLDSDSLNLFSIEAISCALRRSAGLLCPCSASTLIRNVISPMRGIIDNIDEYKEAVENTLDSIIAHGDIFEYLDVENNDKIDRSFLLYIAPPAFIVRNSGLVILLGIIPDQVSALPKEMELRIEYVNHIRRLRPNPNEDLRSELIQCGLIELLENDWLKKPPIISSEQLFYKYNKLLNEAKPSYDIAGLQLLDPDRPVRFYRGRWVNPGFQTGCFVARRAKAYGAPLWCFVQLNNGNSQKIIDFPTSITQFRGCDEAWHLQAAIDANRGKPQLYRVHPGPEESFIFDFFSPVPVWAHRRWSTIGEPIPTSGCLFSYRIPELEIQEEINYIESELWMKRLESK